MGAFFQHARGTGGGSPHLPPEEDGEDDGVNVNFVPIDLPESLQVMGPPPQVDPNIMGNNDTTNGKT